MPAGMIVARTWASWPAPLGIRMRFACRDIGCSFLDRALKRLVHHRGLAGADALDLDAAPARRGDLVCDFAQQRFETFDDGGVVVANLEQHFGAAGNDAGRAGIERDAAGGPDGSRAAR